MAIGAAEITACQKYRAGDLTGIIQQRQLLQSANTHGDTPPFRMQDGVVQSVY